MRVTMVNQKFWKLFKQPTVSLSYLSTYVASCTDDSGHVSIDIDVLVETLKVSRQEVQDAVELLSQLAVIYPCENGDYLVNPYYIWNGQVLSSEHLAKCELWNKLVKQNPHNVVFCKKYPKSLSRTDFMNVSEVLEILALTIATDKSL